MKLIGKKIKNGALRDAEKTAEDAPPASESSENSGNLNNSDLNNSENSKCSEDSKDSEKSKKEIGDIGEKAAVKYLKKKNYTIIDTNVRVGHSEIDIIALKDDTLAFIEVKTRSVAEGGELLVRPAYAVNKSKAAYLIRGVDGYIAKEHEKYSKYFKRIDIIEVYLKRDGKKLVCSDIMHFENAVRRR